MISNGVKPQQHVGIYLHKCLNLGVTIYGILKAGCVFIPLDPFTPAERLEFILNDCEVNHIVSSDLQLRTLKSLQNSDHVHLYGVETELAFEQMRWSDIRLQPQTAPALDIIDQDLGYIMYTCLLYTSPSPRDATLSRMPSSA